MSMVNIYALICPISLQPKYIGQTSVDLKSRLHNHLCEDKNSAKAKWINLLKESGFKPVIVLLEKCDSSFGDYAESQWIYYFLSKGSDLLNSVNYIGSNINALHTLKLNISAEDYKNWMNLYEHGDYKEIAKKLELTPSRVRTIIHSRKATQDQIAVIRNFYYDRTKGDKAA